APPPKAVSSSSLPPAFFRFAWKPVPGAEPRSGFRLTALSDGRVLMSGGSSGGEGGPTGKRPDGDFCELFDPTTNLWKPAHRLLQGRLDHAAVRLADGRVFVSGGWTDAPKADAEVYDPISDAWTAVGPMNQERSDSTATLLLDGRVLIVGGDAMDH